MTQNDDDGSSFWWLYRRYNIADFERTIRADHFVARQVDRTFFCQASDDVRHECQDEIKNEDWWFARASEDEIERRIKRCQMKIVATLRHLLSEGCSESQCAEMRQVNELLLEIGVYRHTLRRIDNQQGFGDYEADKEEIERAVSDAWPEIPECQDCRATCEREESALKKLEAGLQSSDREQQRRYQKMKDEVAPALCGLDGIDTFIAMLENMDMPKCPAGRPPGERKAADALRAMKRLCLKDGLSRAAAAAKVIEDGVFKASGKSAKNDLCKAYRKKMDLRRTLTLENFMVEARKSDSRAVQSR